MKEIQESTEFIRRFRCCVFSRANFFSDGGGADVPSKKNSIISTCESGPVCSWMKYYQVVDRKMSAHSAIEIVVDGRASRFGHVHDKDR